jgi:hypothetical protein
MTVEELEHGMRHVTTLKTVKASGGLVVQRLSLDIGLAAHAPGMVEVNPVDVGCHIGNIVAKGHGVWQNLISSPM